MEKLSDENRVALVNLLRFLFLQGLGEHLILHKGEHKIYLGKISYEKGKLVIRDQGYLSEIKSDSLLPCWDNGVLGTICSTKGKQWDSLTFCGLDQCDLKADLSKTRHLALAAAENQYGDHLIDFVGSVYRGFQLMLDNHFLPVVLLTQLRTKFGENGLAVSDLRAAPMPLSVLKTVHDVVRESVEKRLTLDVDEMQVNPELFHKMFSDYLPKD